MSGRKSGEVIAVLKKNKEIIEDSQNCFDKEINKKINNISDSSEKIEKRKSTVNEISVYKGKNLEFFSNEIEDLDKRLQDVKINLANIKVDSKDLTSIIKKNDKINSSIKSLLDEGESIRKNVSSHYQDDNYNNARSIQMKINVELRKKSEVIKELEISWVAISEKIKNSEQLFQEAKRIQEQSNDYENRAKLKLEEIQATEIKIETQKIFDSIEKDIANKFSKDNYHELKTKLERFFGKSDKEIINQFDEICKVINTVKEETYRLFEKWKSEKQKAVSLLQSVIDKISTTEIDDPINRNSLGLFEFEKKYMRTDSENLIQSEVKIIKNKIETDEFENAEILTKELVVQIQELKDKAIQQSIKLKKNYQLTKDTVNAFKKLNYNISLTTVAEDKNPIDGYRIICKVGNEVLEFSPIVTDDGDVSYNINHVLDNGQEATNCKMNMKQIYDALQQEGVPITDIAKNSYSIIHEGRDRIGKKEENKFRARK